jgi:hypothetical protein
MMNLIMSSNPQKNTTSTSEVRPRFSVAIPTYCRTEYLDFFLRLKKAGERVVSAPSILVYEVIPPARETVAYLLQRDFHRAQPYGEFLRRGDFGGSVLVNLSVCLGKLGFSLVAVPLSIFLGPIFFLRTVLLFLRQLGKLVGFLQFTPEEG